MKEKNLSVDLDYITVCRMGGNGEAALYCINCLSKVKFIIPLSALLSVGLLV